MKTIYCLAYILMLTINGNSQKLSLTTKGPYELNLWNSRIIPFENGFVSVETRGDNFKNERPVKVHFTFKIYDQEMALLREILYTDDTKIFGARNAELLRIHNKIWFIYNEIDYKSGIVSNIVAIEINPEKLSIEKSKIVCDVVGLKLNPGHTGNEANLQLIIKTSPDEKKTAFLIKFLGGPRAIIVTDENLDTIWTKKDFIVENNPKVMALAINNSGKVFFGYFSSKLKNSSGNELAVIDKISTTISNPFPEMGYVYSYAFLESKDTKSLHIIGEYSDPDTKSMTGFFHSIINIENNTINKKEKHQLHQELISKLKDEKWAKNTKKNPGVNYPTYWIGYDRVQPKLAELSDGTIVLTLRLQEVVTSGDNRSTHKWTGPILIGIINENNLKFTRLPVSTNHSGNWEEVDDYRLIPYKDKLIMIYNDALENLQYDINNTQITKYLPKGIRDQKLALIYGVLEKDGSIKRYQLSPENYFGITQFAVTVDSRLRLILNSLEKDYKTKLMGSLLIE